MHLCFSAIGISDVIGVLNYLSVPITLIMVYFNLNKLWKRKHERVVAESISLPAKSLDIVQSSVFMLEAIFITGNVGMIIGRILAIFSFSVQSLIGVGIWVKDEAKRGFWELLKQALRLEREESGYLARTILRPSGADVVIDLLSKIALIDDKLDDKERSFIDSFAASWKIDFDWDKIAERQHYQAQSVTLEELRGDMKRYLSNEPPHEQVQQLGDVLTLLVKVDGEVAPEEELIMHELTGLMNNYIDPNVDSHIHTVVVTPQTPRQAEWIRHHYPKLRAQKVSGGDAFIEGPYFSRKYADILSARYQTDGLFSVVMERPSGAQQIVNILKQVALLDQELDRVEREFIESFAYSWNIYFSWDDFEERHDNRRGGDPQRLREEVKAYLATLPPVEQVQEFADVLNVLSQIDGEFHAAEAVVIKEIRKLMDAYIKPGEASDIFAVAIVPQHPNHVKSIERLFPAMQKEDLNGGTAYVEGPYFSRKYADFMCSKYRTLRYFAVVVDRTQGRADVPPALAGNPSRRAQNGDKEESP